MSVFKCVECADCCICILPGAFSANVQGSAIIRPIRGSYTDNLLFYIAVKLAKGQFMCKQKNLVRT